MTRGRQPFLIAESEKEALDIMIPPGAKRPGKFLEGVIQICVTRACDMCCFGCTQGSNLRGPYTYMTPTQFKQAVLSLKTYFGVVGVFGGNPAVSPFFGEYCQILAEHIPRYRRGLWCNNPLGMGKLMRATFNPAVSNLNVHLNKKAFDEFKADWPECRPVGLKEDSRHSPPYIAMKDLDELPGKPGYETSWTTRMPNTADNRWRLIVNCDINRHWSALIGVFRGKVRAWFCEVAGAQAMLHQNDPDYPDTGIAIDEDTESPIIYEGKTYSYWWQLPMTAFAEQARKHCHECGVPLRGYGELAQAAEGNEEVTITHAAVYRPKKTSHRISLVTVPPDKHVYRVIDYIKNAGK